MRRVTFEGGLQPLQHPVDNGRQWSQWQPGNQGWNKLASFDVFDYDAVKAKNLAEYQRIWHENVQLGQVRICHKIVKL